MDNSFYIDKFRVYLIEEKKVSTHTVESYLRDIKQFNDFCLKQNIIDFSIITKTQIISYLIYLQKKGKATSTITRSLAALRGLFDYLLNCGYIILNPTINLETPKIEKKIPQTLTIKEVEKFLEMPDISTKKGIRDKAILELLYSTGLKVSELINLKLDNINIDKRIIHSCHDSNKREIPIGSVAIEYIEKYLLDCREDILKDKSNNHLFVNMQGCGMTRQGLWKIIKGYTKEAKIKKTITPHMIRHSFALHLIQNGADLHSVQELLGHADISSTQVYIRASNHNINEIYNNSHPRA
jgi:integrase/recombinase XerD